VTTGHDVEHDGRAADALSAVIAELSVREARSSDERTLRAAQPSPLSIPAQLLVVFALFKIAGAAATILIGSASPAPPTAVPSGVIALQLAAFGGTGIALLLAHGRDRRTAYLGVVFVITASSFATGYFARFAQLHDAFRLLAPLYPDAFLAFFLARLLGAFPYHNVGRPLQVKSLLLWVSGGVGAVLFVANAVVGWRLVDSTTSLLGALQRQSASNTVYWTVICLLVVAILTLAAVGTAQLPKDERRRLQLFWGAFGIGLGPIFLITAIGIVPGLGPVVIRVSTETSVLYVLEALLVCLPLTMAYAVLVRRVLPARFILRRAAQHVLARWTLRAALIVPLSILLVKMYVNRDETIAGFFRADGVRLLGLMSVVVVALLGRDVFLRYIDTWCFRDAPDLRAIFADLVEQSRRATRVDELVAFLTAAIERAFRPERVAVLVRDPTSEQFLSVFGAAEPLPSTSVLVETLSARADMLEVDLENPSSALRWLPREERAWLVDSGARILAPLRSSQREMVGLIAVGDRKSELPYASEDLRVLSTIADTGAFSIENQTMRHTSGVAVDDWWQISLAHRLSYAAECATCGRVFPSGTDQCAACGTVPGTSQVPEVLFGKFRFEQRIGHGGMGVVYRATDLALDRTVAIKTLPGTSPELAQRLRLEARAMAAVTHRNLAIIHGIESWRGRPLLVVEFMSRGTLATRLRSGPLDMRDGLAFAVDIAEALEVVHAAGLLHRDIKPSNIGFGQDGVPKLLDFGLVHLLTKAATEGTLDTGCSEQTDEPPNSLSIAGRLIGTPLYMSPEAIAGGAPTESFDLWSLNVLLFEAVTGVHPFRGRSVDETLQRIQRGHSPLDQSGLPGTVQRYFERSLHADAQERYRTAHDTADAIRSLLTHF